MCCLEKGMKECNITRTKKWNALVLLQHYNSCEKNYMWKLITQFRGNSKQFSHDDQMERKWWANEKEEEEAMTLGDFFTPFSHILKLTNYRGSTKWSEGREKASSNVGSKTGFGAFYNHVADIIKSKALQQEIIAMSCVRIKFE